MENIQRLPCQTASTRHWLAPSLHGIHVHVPKPLVALFRKILQEKIMHASESPRSATTSFRARKNQLLVRSDPFVLVNKTADIHALYTTRYIPKGEPNPPLEKRVADPRENHEDARKQENRPPALACSRTYVSEPIRFDLETTATSP